MVHDDGTRPQPGARRGEGGRGGQGERVGAAAARHEHERPGVQLGEPGPDGAADGGDGRAQPWTRRTQAIGSAISAGSGSVLGDVHTALNPSVPTSCITPRTNRAPSAY